MAIRLISYIVPKNPFAYVVDETHVKGSYRYVPNILSRDAIPLLRRQDGMMVFVKTGINGVPQIFNLILGTVDNDLSNNLNWVEFINSKTKKINVVKPPEVLIVQESEELHYKRDFYNKGVTIIEVGSGLQDFGVGMQIPTHGILIVEGSLINDGLIVNSGLLIT